MAAIQRLQGGQTAAEVARALEVHPSELLGISGAVQHLAGMKTSGTIIAVNTDPEAAIFNVAHFGAVADLFDVAAELEKLS